MYIDSLYTVQSLSFEIVVRCLYYFFSTMPDMLLKESHGPIAGLCYSKAIFLYLLSP